MRRIEEPETKPPSIDLVYEPHDIVPLGAALRGLKGQVIKMRALGQTPRLGLTVEEVEAVEDTFIIRRRQQSDGMLGAETRISNMTTREANIMHMAATTMLGEVTKAAATHDAVSLHAESPPPTDYYQAIRRWQEYEQALRPQEQLPRRAT